MNDRAGVIGWWTGWLRDSQITRFIIAGSVNTVVTYAIYVGLVMFLPYAIAYTLTTALGIWISYFLNARFVFRRRLALSAALQYPIVYLLQYLLGLLLLYLLVEKAGFSKFFAPLLIVCVSVPLTFVLSRYIIGRTIAERDSRDTMSDT